MEQKGENKTREMVKFIKLFDRTFDCLNVMSRKGGGKPDRQPYYEVNDPRFEV